MNHPGLEPIAKICEKTPDFFYRNFSMPATTLVNHSTDVSEIVSESYNHPLYFLRQHLNAELRDYDATRWPFALYTVRL